MSIVPATLEVLEAFQRDVDDFAALISSPVPAGWPEFPDGIEFTIDKLRERPDQAGWWMHPFFDSTGRLVEIGYEIAAEFRGHRCATAAARAMVEKARTEGAVHTVIAQTLPDEEQGTVWCWELPVD